MQYGIEGVPEYSIKGDGSLQVYFINLDKSTDRLANMRPQLDALGYAYKVYNDTRKYALAIQMQQIMNEKKEVFINQIIADISDWYNKLSSKSDDILRTFNLSI